MCFCVVVVVKLVKNVVFQSYEKYTNDPIYGGADYLFYIVLTIVHEKTIKEQFKWKFLLQIILQLEKRKRKKKTVTQEKNRMRKEKLNDEKKNTNGIEHIVNSALKNSSITQRGKLN